MKGRFVSLCLSLGLVLGSLIAVPLAVSATDGDLDTNINDCDTRGYDFGIKGFRQDGLSGVGAVACGFMDAGPDIGDSNVESDGAAGAYLEFWDASNDIESIRVKVWDWNGWDYLRLCLYDGNGWATPIDEYVINDGAVPTTWSIDLPDGQDNEISSFILHANWTSCP